MAGLLVDCHADQMLVLQVTAPVYHHSHHLQSVLPQMQIRRSVPF